MVKTLGELYTVQGGNKDSIKRYATLPFIEGAVRNKNVIINLDAGKSSAFRVEYKGQSMVITVFRISDGTWKDYLMDFLEIDGTKIEDLIYTLKYTLSRLEKELEKKKRKSPASTATKKRTKTRKKSKKSRTYVDNAKNRMLKRVGKKY
jgi:hypothetical protein